MEIKKANLNDIIPIMSIYDDAKESFLNDGYAQWNKSYPNEEDIINDINNQSLYICIKNNQIIGVITLVIGNDFNYNSIDGNWISNNDYLTIHRIAVKKEYYRQGIAKKLLNYGEAYALNNNIKSIRIDTHEMNYKMQNLLNALNYSYCGIIHLIGVNRDAKRLAYEKILD